MFTRLGVILVVAALCLCCTSAQAARSFVFDFENDSTLPTDPVAVFSVFKDIPGETAEALQFSKTEDFIHIVDLSGIPGAGSFGSHSLQAADSGTNLFDAGIARLVNHFSFDIGALSTSDLSFTVRAFRDRNYKDVPPGGLLKTITGVLPGDATGAFHTTTVTLDGLLMDRVEFLAGPPGNQDTSYDNFNVTMVESSDIAVPLPPAALAAIGTALLALFLQRRARRAKSI
jgi:hypothetical protein